MFGLGMGEIVVILIVALLVLGPTKLPEAAKTIGKAIRELRKHTDSLKETIETDEQLGGTVRELRSALRGDPYYNIMSRLDPSKPPAEPEPGEATDKPAETAAPAETPAVPPHPEGTVAQAEGPEKSTTAAPESDRTHG